MADLNNIYAQIAASRASKNLQSTENAAKTALDEFAELDAGGREGAADGRISKQDAAAMTDFGSFGRLAVALRELNSQLSSYADEKESETRLGISPADLQGFLKGLRLAKDWFAAQADSRSKSLRDMPDLLERFAALPDEQQLQIRKALKDSVQFNKLVLPAKSISSVEVAVAESRFDVRWAGKVADGRTVTDYRARRVTLTPLAKLDANADGVIGKEEVNLKRTEQQERPLAARALYNLLTADNSKAVQESDTSEAAPSPAEGLDKKELAEFISNLSLVERLFVEGATTEQGAPSVDLTTPGLLERFAALKEEEQDTVIKTLRIANALPLEEDRLRAEEQAKIRQSPQPEVKK